MNDHPHLMTAEEAAAVLRVSERRLSDWRKRSYGPPWIRVGKGALYPAAELRSWLASRAEAGAAA